MRDTGREEKPDPEDEPPAAQSTEGYLQPSIDMPQRLEKDEDHTKKRNLENLDTSNKTMSQEEIERLQSLTNVLSPHNRGLEKCTKVTMQTVLMLHVPTMVTTARNICTLCCSPSRSSVMNDNSFRFDAFHDVEVKTKPMVTINFHLMASARFPQASARLILATP